jgi:hypothetical protein
VLVGLRSALAGRGVIGYMVWDECGWIIDRTADCEVFVGFCSSVLDADAFAKGFEVVPPSS